MLFWPDYLIICSFSRIDGATLAPAFTPKPRKLPAAEPSTQAEEETDESANDPVLSPQGKITFYTY